MAELFRRVNLLDEPISSLGLETRITGALRRTFLRLRGDEERAAGNPVYWRNNPLTLRELLSTPEDQWQRGNGLGPIGYRTLCDRLKEHGLSASSDLTQEVMVYLPVEPQPQAAPNGGCLKCGRQTDLHQHHLVARSDGGPDSVENYGYLCGACHWEWHGIEQIGGMQFSQWLATPPLFVLVAAFRVDWPEDCSAAEVQRELRAYHEQMRNAADWRQFMKNDVSGDNVITAVNVP